MFPNEVYVAIFSCVREPATFAALCLVSKETRANMLAAVAALDTGSRARGAACLAPFAGRAGKVRLSGVFYLTRLEELEFLSRFVPGRLTVYFAPDDPCPDDDIPAPEGHRTDEERSESERADAAIAALLARGQKEHATLTIHDTTTDTVFVARRGYAHPSGKQVRKRFLAAGGDPSRVAWPDKVKDRMTLPASRDIDLLVVGRDPFRYTGDGEPDEQLARFGKHHLRSIEFTHAVPIAYRYFCDTMVVPFEPDSLDEDISDAPRWKHIGLCASFCRSMCGELLTAIYEANPDVVVHIFSPSEESAEVMKLRLADGLRGAEVWHADEPEGGKRRPALN